MFYFIHNSKLKNICNIIQCKMNFKIVLPKNFDFTLPTSSPAKEETRLMK